MSIAHRILSSCRVWSGALLALATMLASVTGGGLATAAPPASDDEARREATALYFKGIELADRGAWDAALAQFRAARRLYASWRIVSWTAVSLKQLDRHDEALETFEALLREFAGQLPAEVKETAQRQVDELRRALGLLEIDGAEPGAVISVDGRTRGEYPLPAPLRVSAGSHLIRVFKEGFELFEARVEVAGGKLERVEARLHPLVRSGRLRVAEQRNRELDVVVDGSVVGKAPWEGPLAPGEHVVALRGDGELGTPPLRVVVGVERTAILTLEAESLAAQVRIEPVPVTADVAIDRVTIGHGIWEGRLRAGDHLVEVAAPGFTPESRRVVVGSSSRDVVRVTLERDDSSPFWHRPPRRPRFLLEESSAILFVPSFGSSVAGDCPDPCRSGPGPGGMMVLHAGYELGSGLGFGVSAGYMAATQGVQMRRTSVTPIGLRPDNGTIDDVLALRSGIGGAWIGYAFGEQARVGLRLGVGLLAGSLLDERTNGTFQLGADVSSGTYSAARAIERHRIVAVYGTPEARIGLPLSRHLALSTGIAIPMLFVVQRPFWDAKHEVSLGQRGLGRFSADALTSGLIVSIAPGIGARYDF